MLKQDKEKKIQFAALQSVPGQRLLQQYHLPTDNFQSFVLIADGRVYQRSAAALKVASYLPWYWQWTRLGWLIPFFIRDAIYNYVADNRYKWFGKKEVCMVPSVDIKDRFLD